jgi:hypothetical protein
MGVEKLLDMHEQIVVSLAHSTDVDRPFRSIAKPHGCFDNTLCAPILHEAHLRRYY